MSKKYSQGKFDPKHPLITQSFLNMFADCPYAAFRRYVQGEIVPPGIAAIQGSAADAAVTLGADSVIKTGIDAPLSDKKDIAATMFDEGSKNALIHKDDDLPSLKDETISLVALHHIQVAKTLQPVETQKGIIIKGPEYDLAGTLDLVETNNLISDLKTSGRAGQYPEKGFLQKEMYTKLYKEETGQTPTGFRFDVLVKTKVPKVERVLVKPEENNPGVLEHMINSTMIELKNGLETGVWRIAAPGHWRCEKTGKWCAYLNNGCPKGKKL